MQVEGVIASTADICRSGIDDHKFRLHAGVKIQSESNPIPALMIRAVTPAVSRQ